jgi:addiction module RelE/StbE family toxin
MNSKLPRIDFSKRFDKQLKKAPLSVKRAFRRRLELFLKDPNHSLLNNHALRGRLKGYRSLNITGNWRAIFRIYHKGNLIFFDALGTHSK